MSACYHPMPDRYDMGMGWEKCPWCLDVRYRERSYWPPTAHKPWWLP